MAKVSNDILEIIDKYINLLNSNGINIQSAYLFGSYSNGNPNEISDIDLAIISDKFEGNRYLDRMKIKGLYRKIDLRLSPYPIIESDLSDNPFVQQEIISKGIKLF